MVNLPFEENAICFISIKFLFWPATLFNLENRKNNFIFTAAWIIVVVGNILNEIDLR